MKTAGEMSGWAAGEFGVRESSRALASSGRGTKKRQRTAAVQISALRLAGVASLFVAALLCGVAARAAIVVPGANGSDGGLNITNNTVIDLSQAVTADWDSDNSPNAGKGVYDSNKWAVVFKYTNVTIASGATVTFKNHPSRAPVVWLVSESVAISGTVNLDGQSEVATGSTLSEPGPGGFRGSARFLNANVKMGGGFGVGGGYTSVANGNGGSYGTMGATPVSYPSLPTYGNPSLLPLIGGSGGAGGFSDIYSTGGGAGGGALLLACSNSVLISGVLQANGGSSDRYGGRGSGGGLRVLCDALNGSGQLLALGGGGNGHAGGVGRVRLERVSTGGAISPNPAPSTIDLSTNAVALLWPPTNAPEVRVVSIGGVNAPADPRAAFGTYGADVALEATNSSVVVVETINVEAASQVKVRVTPRDTYNATESTAAVVATNSLSPLTLIWNATVPAQLGYSAVQVKVIRP